MANELALFTFILNHILLLIGIISCSLLLLVSAKRNLLRRAPLRLLHALVTLNLVTYLSEIPYSIYFTAGWNPILLDYNPLIVWTTNILGIVNIKGSISILIGIACDRVYAFYNPTGYRFLNHAKYANIAIYTGLFLGVMDYFFLLLWSFPLGRVPGCAAHGCFMEDHARGISSIANGFMGLILLLITLLLIIKLKIMKIKATACKDTHASCARDLLRFSKANKIAMCSLLSGTFLSVPGVAILFGHAFAFEVGAFFYSAVLLAGCLNSISQLVMNRELQLGLKSLVNRKSSHLGMISSTQGANKTVQPVVNR